jgi:Protein of unknown function (DUF2752)
VIFHSSSARRPEQEHLVTAEHSSSAEHVHSSECAPSRSRFASMMQLPVAPLRWLIVGCFGLAAVGLILPFSPIPPCPLHTFTGVPCPFCGMTRSARSLMRLDLASSLRFQPFGVLAFVGGLVILGMWAVPQTRKVSMIRVPIFAVIVLFAASWIWNIAFNPTFA